MPLISPDIFIHKMFNQMDLSEDGTMSYNTQKMSINIVKQASLMWHIYLKTKMNSNNAVNTHQETQSYSIRCCHISQCFL